MTSTPTLSLAAKYYTDPEVFKIETNGLLARTWQFAGHASQLKETGDYFTFDMAGETLFCIKGRDGEIRTFYNVCHTGSSFDKRFKTKRPIRYHYCSLGR